jgi:hypothetical protein
VRKSISDEERAFVESPVPELDEPESDEPESFPITNANAATEKTVMTRAKIVRMRFD